MVGVLGAGGPGGAVVGTEQSQALLLCNYHLNEDYKKLQDGCTDNEDKAPSVQFAKAMPPHQRQGHWLYQVTVLGLLAPRSKLQQSIHNMLQRFTQQAVFRDGRLFRWFPTFDLLPEETYERQIAKVPQTTQLSIMVAAKIQKLPPLWWY